MTDTERKKELTFTLLNKWGNSTIITMTDKAIVEMYAEKFGFTKRPQDNNSLPEPMDNGGYFGTHCHICHEAVGICTCVRKDNNALVPLDFQVIFDMLFDRTQYSVDSCKDIAEEICAKFGKDNSGMVLDKKEIRRTINEIQVPYADSQTGRIALTIYIDLIVEAIYSKFSQQPPKERKVSLEEIKIIKGNSY